MKIPNNKFQITNISQSTSFRVVFLGLLLVTGYLLLGLPKAADAATLYISPPEAEIYLGDTFSAELRIDTQGEIVNTIGANVFALGDELSITDFSLGQSVFSTLIDGPEYSGEGNAVSFQAIALGGFEGDGLIGRIFFRADKPGFTMARLSIDSQVFLHDGHGTPAAMNFEHAEYSVVDVPEDAPSLRSETHPLSERWYTEGNARITWEMRPGARYLFVFGTDPQAEPDQEIEEGVNEIELDIAEDGIYYLRFLECFGEECGPIVTRTIMKDATPPEEFDVFLGHGHDAYEGNKFISFSATDETSGVERYEAQEDNGDWAEAKSPYVLRDQNARIVRVKAIDKAGNERISELNIRAQLSSGYSPPLFVVIIIVGVMSLVAGFIYIKKRRVTRNK